MGLFSSLSKIITRRPDRYTTTTLHNPNPFADIFGVSVAISGDYAVVGSQETTEVGTSGTAYIYNLSSQTPTVPIITLNHPDPEEIVYSDNFSSTVAVDGNLVLVGAETEQGEYYEGWDDFILQENSGKAYIFDIDGKITTEAITFKNPVRRFPCENSFFGSRLAINGMQSIIGTNRDLSKVTDRTLLNLYGGCVFLFNNNTGTITHTLTSPAKKMTPEYFRFGSSVDIYNKLAIVGACNKTNDRDESLGSPPLPQEIGQAYIFNLATGSSCIVLENPNVHGLSNGDQFGYVVRIHEHTCIVSAPGEDSGSPLEQNNVGVVYLYDIPNGAEFNNDHGDIKPQIITAPEGSKRFGHSMDICESYIAIGAPDIDFENEKDNGKIFVYERNNLTEPYAVINNPNPDGIYPTYNFGSQLSLSGNRIIANVCQDRLQDEDDYIEPGNVYIFELKDTK